MVCLPITAMSMLDVCLSICSKNPMKCIEVNALFQNYRVPEQYFNTWLWNLTTLEKEGRLKEFFKELKKL